MKQFTVRQTEEDHHLLVYNIFHGQDPHYQPSKLKTNVSNKPAPPHPILGDYSGFMSTIRFQTMMFVFKCITMISNRMLD